MWQALDLGLAAIAQRAVTLGDQLRDQLSGLPGVSTHDLGQTRCAIVTAKVKNRPAEEVAAALGRAAVNVSTTVPEDNPLDTEDRGIHPLIRFSPHYYNTEDEIDHAAELLAPRPNDRLAEFTAPDRPCGVAKVLPYLRRSTLSAANGAGL